MEISIRNCNNIDEGSFSIKIGCLNIKYGINGTGKTTITKALEAFINNNGDGIDSLKPFKYLDTNDKDHSPSLTGYETINTLAIFNEAYINNYVFQKNDLIKNSFEIFVKTPDYDEKLQEIENNLAAIKNTFKTDEDLNSLISVFQTFIDGFGKAKGYSKSGSIGKGLAKGNKLENIPKGLEVYSGYLKNDKNTKWIQWQQEGSKSYLDIVENQCPYCSGSIEEKKETILKVSKEYDKTLIENINIMIDALDKLEPYFAEVTANKIKMIKKNASGLGKQDQDYLVEIKKQVENVHSLLVNLKGIDFNSLKDQDDISHYLQSFRIVLSYYSHLNSKLMNEKIDLLNGRLDSVIIQANILQGLVKKQRDALKRAIKTNSDNINAFLKKSGMSYEVIIDETDSDYHLLLKHISGREITKEAGNSLSYGEKNAFALALFMYDAIKKNPDLIVLDDPVSSFDGNKRFALINLLFMGQKSLNNRTVLLLTHEFQTVIDILYVMPFNFNPQPTGSFMCTKNGNLTEKTISKEDFHSAVEVADLLINSGTNIIVKLVNLRNKLEILGKTNQSYNIVSSLFHHRNYPTDKNEKPLSQEDNDIGTSEIKEIIPSFDYNDLLSKLTNNKYLKELYRNCSTGYEKACIFRTMFGDDKKSVTKDKVFWKHLNEIYHIENVFLYQLNPNDFDTVPQFVIEQCDRIINENSNLNNNTEIGEVN